MLRVSMEVIKAGEAKLVLVNGQRLNGAIPVANHLDALSADAGQHPLGNLGVVVVGVARQRISLHPSVTHHSLLAMLDPLD